MTKVYRFLNQETIYQILSHQSGKIIFTERSEEKLSGTFEFEASLTSHPVYGTADSVLHITNGKFSIIPAL